MSYFKKLLLGSLKIEKSFVKIKIMIQRSDSAKQFSKAIQRSFYLGLTHKCNYIHCFLAAVGFVSPRGTMAKFCSLGPKLGLNRVLWKLRFF